MIAQAKEHSRVIGIVGSRKRDSDKDLRACIKDFDKVYRKGDTLVSGGCPRGGDRFAEIISDDRGIPLTIYYPDWEWQGRSAGFKRNTLIAEDCDILIAVVEHTRQGGTEDTIHKTKMLSKEVVIVK